MGEVLGVVKLLLCDKCVKCCLPFFPMGATVTCLKKVGVKQVLKENSFIWALGLFLMEAMAATIKIIMPMTELENLGVHDCFTQKYLMFHPRCASIIQYFHAPSATSMAKVRQHQNNNSDWCTNTL